MKTIAPLSVRHDWTRDSSSGYVKAHDCPTCGARTANLPKYKFDVCPAKDRRKGKPDRRRK